MLHLLQSSQEGLILRLQTFCREQILDKLFEQQVPIALPLEAEVIEKPKPDQT